MLRACRAEAGSVHFKHLLLLLLLYSTVLEARMHSDLHYGAHHCLLSRDGREALQCISLICGFSGAT